MYCYNCVKFIAMELLVKVLLLVVLGIFLILCLRGLIFAWYKLYDLRQAEKHPENFFHTDGVVFNKKTKKLEDSSRPILPSE